jgi:mono/diheme cytochrome c family protein
MKSLLILFSAATFAVAAHASPDASGDLQAGKALHDKDCVGCHAKMFGGDGSKIYTRADHKVKNKQQLAARISACNANVGAGWFPEDEAHVAAYLNQQYYKFK